MPKYQDKIKKNITRIGGGEIKPQLNRGTKYISRDHDAHYQGLAATL